MAPVGVIAVPDGSLGVLLPKTGIKTENRSDDRRGGSHRANGTPRRSGAGRRPSSPRPLGGVLGVGVFERYEGGRLIG